MKKILFLLVFLLILGGAGFYLYKTNLFQARDKATALLSDIPFVSKTLGFDVKYWVSGLNRKKYKDKLLKYNIEKEEVPFKEIPLEHEDRYVLIPAMNKSQNSGEKGKFNYPSTGKEEYTPEKLAELASIYSAMEPEQAVSILEQLDDDVIIGIFSNMKTENVAEIMGALEPKRASKISVKMLEKKNEQSKEGASESTPAGNE